MTPRRPDAGRRVVVTGASMGIGRAIALRFAKDGAKVVLSARDPERLETVAREVREAGGEARAIAGDMTKSDDREALIRGAREAWGGIDALVNNAGRGYYGAMRDVNVDELPAIFMLNVFAPLHLTQLALPDLEHSRGTVVMMSSIAGVAAAPKMGAYAASKFALEAISLSLRAEVAASGVHVVVIRPGPVDTPFRQNAVARNVEAGVRTRGAQEQTAEEIAERTHRAVLRGTSVAETSSYVRVASFAARTVPPLFRAITARMARSSGV